MSIHYEYSTMNRAVATNPDVGYFYKQVANELRCLTFFVNTTH